MGNLQEIVGSAIKLAKTLTPGVSALVGGVFYLGKAERLVNRAFESNSDELVVKLNRLDIFWVEYEKGSFQRFFLLLQGLGFWRTLRTLRQNAISDRCKNWDGAERHTHRGSFRNREHGESNDEVKRRTDSSEFIARINRRMSPAILN